MSRDLWTVCTSEFFPRRLRLRSAKTRVQYKYAIDAFGGCLGRIPTLDDLDDDTVTVWLGSLLDSDLSTYTVREKLGRILTLWRWLAARRVVDAWPTIQRPEPPEIVPVAMTEGELSALFDASMREDGMIGPVKAWHWWPAYLQFLWNSAERRTAAMSIRYEWVNLERGFIAIPANVRKGKRKSAIYHLWPKTIELLQRIAEPRRELFFPWPLSEATYWYRFGRICRRAGIPDDRRHKTHGIRCTHATHRYLAGQDATKALMHDDPGTTQRHYIDKSFATPDPPLFDPWARSDAPPPTTFKPWRPDSG